MAIDYDKAAKTYDNTRSQSEEVVKAFLSRVDFSTARFLDFGCGTGNYLKRIHELTGNCGYGVEPSAEMRNRAQEKNPASRIIEGDHDSIGFPNDFFDFIYLTDVIHHVPDLGRLFAELYRTLRPGGALCVLTQSWRQIEARWYNRYFRSLERIEKERYPDIGIMAEAASTAGLAMMPVELIPGQETERVTSEFIRNVRERNFSMFRLIPEEEFAAGLALLERDEGRELRTPGRGSSMLWFKKPDQPLTGSPPALAGEGA